jgi:hypothetical protein
MAKCRGALKRRHEGLEKSCRRRLTASRHRCSNEEISDQNGGGLAGGVSGGMAAHLVAIKRRMENQRRDGGGERRRRRRAESVLASSAALATWHGLASLTSIGMAARIAWRSVW